VLVDSIKVLRRADKFGSLLAIELIIPYDY
jgi:hypothetical protein